MTAALTDIAFTRMDGAGATLADFGGKVLLIVNVASKCGLTPQYEGLQALYAARRQDGFEVLAFPANDFNGQEPGTDAEIIDFCISTYDVEFPVLSKIAVTGSARHSLYAALTQTEPVAVGEGPMRARLESYGVKTTPPPEISWNFEKFLIDRNGQVVGRFAPDVPADDPRLVASIEEALAAPSPS